MESLFNSRLTPLSAKRCNLILTTPRFHRRGALYDPPLAFAAGVSCNDRRDFMKILFNLLPRGSDIGEMRKDQVA